jgi:hypothetical protein
MGIATAADNDVGSWSGPRRGKLLALATSTSGKNGSGLWVEG